MYIVLSQYIYLLPHQSTKTFQRFAKFPQVFNPHFLMVVLLTSCNISHTHGFTVSSSLRLILISERLNKISFFALLTS